MTGLASEAPASTSEAATGEAVEGKRPRWPLIAMACIGIGLAAAPAAFQMFDRAPKGATMIAAFKPFMTESRMNSFKRDIGQIDAGVDEANTKVAAALSGVGEPQAFAATHPDFAQFAKTWPAINSDMSRMLDRIQAQIPNYEAVAALPDFRLFPWFFVIPGVLLAALGLLALARPTWWRGLRWAFAAIGIGLIAAPFAFQMFDRAPKGAEMIEAFRTIETRQKVETIQRYFGDIAAGQGSVRLSLIPALEAKGLDPEQIARRFPAVETLDRHWVPTLQNLTPMIAAMSDNVVNYEAVKALPPFTLFPWFFVLPGLFTLALAGIAGRRRANPPGTHEIQSPTPHPLTERQEAQ